MHQQWRDLTFLHWRVDPVVVASVLPPGVRPDTYDGSAWVGLIPFRMVDAGVGAGPSVAWLGTFAETNVRVYTVDDRGRRGIVFCSLEASRLAVVLGARVSFGLPYCWARMRVDVTGDVLTYTTRRRWPGPRRVGGKIVVRCGEVRQSGDGLADFLTARWGLHTRWHGRTLYVPNEHETWPLHDAELLGLDDGLLLAAGFRGLATRPPDSVLYSPGVTTRFHRPFDARHPR